MVNYICEKCNKEFTQKSNYNRHINRIKSCNNNETIIYKCEKCNKEFNKKSNYLNHINKLKECNNVNLQQKYDELYLELNNIKKNFEELKIENIKINELYNNLLDKCIKNNITNNTITNNNNSNNNNIINITLTNFGKEDYNKLTNDEQLKILKSNNLCLPNLIKYLHINDRIPEYKNICIKKR